MAQISTNKIPQSVNVLAEPDSFRGAILQTSIHHLHHHLLHPFYMTINEQ